MKKAHILFLFAAFLCTIPANGQVAGADSSAISVLSLREIDKIIDEKEYNRALSELSVYMQSHPKDFDRAQERVRRIMKERLNFDSKAEELAHTMRNDEENDDKKMDIIVELENAEKGQTKTAIDLTRQARKTLATRFFIERYNRIMSAGYKLVQDEQYAEAVAKFQEGFSLKGADTDRIFDGSNSDGTPVVYEEDITIPTEESFERISKILPRIERARLTCQEDYEAFMLAVHQNDLQSAENAERRIQSSFGTLANIRNDIMAEIRILRALDRRANERNPLLSGFSYITFTLGFVEGDEQVVDTGILGTIDSFWNTRVESMKKGVYELVLGNLQAAENALPITKIRTMREEAKKQSEMAKKAADFSPLGSSIQSLYGKIEKENGGFLGSDFVEYEKSMKFSRRFSESLADAIDASYFLSDETLKKSAETNESETVSANKDFLEKRLLAAERFEQIAEKSKSEQYVREELIREESYFEIQEILSDPENGNAEKYNQMEVADLVNAQKKVVPTAGVQLEDAVLDFRDVIGYQETLSKMNLSEATVNAKSLWKTLSPLFALFAETESQNATEKLSRAHTLFDGIAENGEVRKYPTEAKELSDELRNDALENAARFERYRTALRAAEKYRREFPTFESDVQKIEESYNALRKMAQESEEISQNAEKQIQLAERAEMEAKAHLARAEAALLRQDFQTAHNALSEASARFSVSFSIQESAQKRAQADESITALSEQIIREENKVVIKDVRRFMNEAQDFYYDGQLDRAEGKLIQARERWAQTNAEQNVEIEEMLEMVTTSRMLQIGRTLKSTDPLYADMSQLLSAASQHYENGVKLIGEKKRQEAVLELEMARDKLEPMKLVYPLNEDASLLRLKIEKILDPESFEAGFKDRVAKARATKNTAEKLASLKDLLAINPSYPGLSKEIEELEYATGLRQRPIVKIDDSLERRANALYAEAQRLFSNANGNQEQLKAASSRLDEIIQLYARNRRATVFRNATALKDRIQTRIGGTVVVALTADDEANFQKAQNAVNRGQLDAANDILERLWQNPAAQKTKKIVDLRTFVKNRL